MPNVDDLQTFLKADNCNDGDIVQFVDAGIISLKDFKQKDGSSKPKVTLEITVLVNGNKRKTYSPNTTTTKILRAAWGKDTEDWFGKKAKVSIIEQLSFGELKKILVLKPLEPAPKNRSVENEVNMATNQAQEETAHAGPVDIGDVIYEE